MIMFSAFETRTTHGQHAKTNSIKQSNNQHHKPPQKYIYLDSYPTTAPHHQHYTEK